MQHDDAPQHRTEDKPLPLPYAQPHEGEDGDTTMLATIGVSCGLVTPVVYAAILLAGRLELHPGFRIAVAMVVLAFGSAVAGVWCSALALRRRRTSGWASAGLLLNVPALFVNCFSLAHVT